MGSRDGSPIYRAAELTLAHGSRDGCFYLIIISHQMLLTDFLGISRISVRTCYCLSENSSSVKLA